MAGALLLAGAAWSVWPVASVTAILLSYIVGLGLANWLLPRLENAPNDSTEKTSNGAATSRSGNRWWWVLLAIAPVVTGQVWKWPLAADWTAFRENVSDRLYLETVPAIMPRLVVSYSRNGS